MSVFLHDWVDGDAKQILSEFGAPDDALDGAEIIVASYSYEHYSGDAFVLFQRDGKLFEVNGSHCSCHGLDSQNYFGTGGTQWEPEETTTDALLVRKYMDPGVMDAIRSYVDTHGPVE